MQIKVNGQHENLFKFIDANTAVIIQATNFYTFKLFLDLILQ